MGAKSRNKGAGHEREVAKLLGTERKGLTYKADSVDGHADVEHDHLYIQCKRRKSIAVARHLEEAEESQAEAEGLHEVKKLPVVVMREDRGTNMVLLRLDDFTNIFNDHRMWRRNLDENDML